MPGIGPVQINVERCALWRSSGYEQIKAALVDGAVVSLSAKGVTTGGNRGPTKLVLGASA